MCVSLNSTQRDYISSAMLSNISFKLWRLESNYDDPKIQRRQHVNKEHIFF